MVDPAHAGRGVGRALGEFVVDRARAAGFHGMQFNAVVETNTVAAKLWQSIGFEIMTTIPEAFDSTSHGLVGLHVMYQSFADPVPVWGLFEGFARNNRKGANSLRWSDAGLLPRRATSIRRFGRNR